MCRKGICVLQCMEACQISPFPHCGLFGDGGSATQFSQSLVQQLFICLSLTCFFNNSQEERDATAPICTRAALFQLPPAVNQQQKQLYLDNQGNNNVMQNYISFLVGNLQYVSQLLDSFNLLCHSEKNARKKAAGSFACTIN